MLWLVNKQILATLQVTEKLAQNTLKWMPAQIARRCCQAPHWGYLIKGDLTVIYTGGETEDTHAGDMFYWPPGHTVKVNQDTEFVLFSPQHEHTIVFDHINSKLGA